MSTSIQPITTTELQGNPTELLKRIEKEGAIPVLVDAKPTLALIRARELKRLRNENARLKRELFARELLAGEEEYKSKGGIGPFSSAKEFMAHLDSSSKMSTDER